MSIEVGAKLPGKVSGITNFGAFIDLGEGKTGLVHISEVSNSYVKDIHDVLSVGDEVTVKVMTKSDDGKIGLSIRKALPPEKVAQTKQRTNSGNNGGDHRRSSGHSFRGSSQRHSQPHQKKQDFDGLMSTFLKESDDRLASLKRNTEGKRGGRGGRRS